MMNCAHSAVIAKQNCRVLDFNKYNEKRASIINLSSFNNMEIRHLSVFKESLSTTLAL